jgi:hypothetical protein
MYPLMAVVPLNQLHIERSAHEPKESVLSKRVPLYSPEQLDRLRKIHDRLIEARRELDALIGDAYLRPRANVVPVHFLDLAAAVEKLRWAEKEWRELDRELGPRERGSGGNKAAGREKSETASSERWLEPVSAE